MLPFPLPFTVALVLIPSYLFADTFGSGADEFTIDFVHVSPGANSDDTGYGAVIEEYRMGKHEIRRSMIIAYNNLGGSPAITMADMADYGGNGSNRPATGISWNEAARFVNWLNTSNSYPPAYKFTTTGNNDNIAPWSPGEAGYDASNPYRHSGALYYLPSEDEWYRAAYYDDGSISGTSGYYDYAFSRNTPPTSTAGNTDIDTAVYDLSFYAGPADVTNAGGPSPYGTIGQNGNVFEWCESAFSGTNSSGNDTRTLRGGYWHYGAEFMISSSRYELAPTEGNNIYGFRVASAVNVELPEQVLTLSNLRHLTNSITADIASNQGNVDVYRSTDLSDFGTAPIMSNLAPGSAVVIDNSPPSGKAFYILVPTGAPSP